MPHARILASRPHGICRPRAVVREIVVERQHQPRRPRKRRHAHPQDAFAGRIPRLRLPSERRARIVKDAYLRGIGRQTVGCRDADAEREVGQRLAAIVIHDDGHLRTTRHGQRHRNVPNIRPRLAELVHRAEPDRVARARDGQCRGGRHRAIGLRAERDGVRPRGGVRPAVRPVPVGRHRRVRAAGKRGLRRERAARRDGRRHHIREVRGELPRRPVTPRQLVQVRRLDPVRTPADSFKTHFIRARPECILCGVTGTHELDGLP